MSNEVFILNLLRYTFGSENKYVEHIAEQIVIQFIS
jgi:hypothetical protein